MKIFQQLRMCILPMPTTYAHHRFGAEMLEFMPGDIRGTAQRYRRLFHVGLHGPDPLFFYRPVFSGKIHRLGRKFHMQTGREFFSRACRSLRMEPDEGGCAYLYGVLCHFVLDACCHPLLRRAEKDGAAGHMRIERSFDRFLMEADGIRIPGGMPIATGLKLNSQECELVSSFYPGTDRRIILESVQTMALVERILEMPPGPARNAVTQTVSALSGTFRDMLAGQKPDPACAPWENALLEKYRQAAELFPDMLLRLIAHLNYNAPLGDRFDPVFG